MKAEANGITLHYRDEGSGPALLLLHAFPLSGAMWRPQIEGLSGEARLIVPDLRGFGETEAPSDPYTLDDMATDMVALLNRLNVDQVILCGLSMGGYLSFAFLRQAKDRVRGVILADTKAGDDTEEARSNRIAMAEKAEREGSGPIAEVMPEKLLGRTTREERPELVDDVKAMIRANSGAGIAGAQRAMAQRPDSTPLLPEIDVPALVIVGKEDELTRPAEAEKMLTALPQARCEVIPQAGHLANMEQPEAFNALVREFLKELKE
ncbi:MAG: alpha/beta hydrolase [Armatimonadetes bacterium]|nr:alpha/beta hydrolase [Armatimonadota bacterium]